MNKELERIHDRIRKLLAMSKDASSPNEAAIAARRARHLMDEYQVSELDLTSVKDAEFGGANADLGTVNTSRVAGGLAICAAKLNDCQVRYVKPELHLELRFEGLLADAVCAREMFRYLKDLAYKLAAKKARGRADRHAYRVGFCVGVRDQVEAILGERQGLKDKTGKALVVCKQALVRQHFGKAKYGTNRAKVSGSAYAHAAGYRDGKKVSLNRQVRGNGQGRLSHAS